MPRNALVNGGLLLLCIGALGSCGSEEGPFFPGVGGGSDAAAPDVSSDGADDVRSASDSTTGAIDGGVETGDTGGNNPSDGGRSDTGTGIDADAAGRDAGADSTVDASVIGRDAGLDARVDVAPDAVAGSNDARADAGGNHFDYLVIILMENKQLAEIYGPATYMTQLADANTLLQHYTAVDHPSEPNYLAIAAGQTFNPPSGDDGYHVFTATNLVDRLEAVGKTWRAYSESAAGACDTANPDIRHIPFLFFADVVNSPTRCARVLPTTPNTDNELVAELNSSAPSNLIWLTPNDTNNMHNTTVTVGDAYLAGLVPRILSSATFTTKRAALLVTFDEGEATFPDDLVYTVWAGPVVKKGQKFTTSHNHYSVLATLAENWGFSPITANDATATPMTEVFQ